MRNVYEIEVRARCPVNPTERDVYRFTIESESLIEVEKIVAFFKAHANQKKIFQEDLTRRCAVAIGAKVTSVGWHGDVKVTSVAP